MEFKTIIEPFRIRQVQPIHSTSREERVAAGALKNLLDLFAGLFTRGGHIRNVLIFM